MEAFSAGTLAGAGSFRCEECGYGIALHERDQVPACPRCGSSRFKRARLFEPPTPIEEAPATAHETPGWLAGAREDLDEPGDYLAYEDGDEIRVIALHDEWTRIGRGLSAQVRFDDPTVSRRHALVHRRDGTARILDDRSLNGVFLNGERVDWHEMSDGDEVAVGRFRLFFINRDQTSSEARGRRGVALA